MEEDVISISELEIPVELKVMLKAVFNARTVDDLLDIPCKEIYKAIENPDLMYFKPPYYNAKSYQRILSYNVHKLGKCLKGV